MFTRKTYIRIKPMVIILLFATLVLAMSSASAADDGIADDAAIADAVDYSVDEVSASSDDVAIDTESSDIYSVDDATVTEDDDASGEIITDTDSDAASEEPKAPLATPSGSEENLGVGTEDVTIDLTQGKLYGGDVCDFTITFSEADAGGTVTVTIIDTTVPEDTNRRTFVYTIPVVSGEAKASSATSITVNGADASFAEVLLWPEFRTEWDNGVQRFPDSVTIAYSGDDTYAPKTVEKSLTVYPFEAKMEIDITQGQGRENEITYGNPLGLVLFEVYNPFEFDNPLYGGNLNVYIVNGDEVDPDEFNPTTDIDKIIKKSVVNINDGDGSITFNDIFEEGYYLIGIYFDEINHPRYNVWEGFNIIKDTQVGPFVVSSNGLAYQTLAEALAVATEDDTITVIKEGTYKGTQNTGLEIAKSVTIAAAGELAVTFDCEENNNFITVKSGKTVTLKDIAVKNGKADKGGAVYVENGAKLNVDDVEFSHNVANVRGGAIYSEGEVGVMDSIFYQNDITTRNANVGNGGAAIYNNGGKLFVYDSTFDENLLNYVPRGTDGATGDLIDGVIVSSGTTVIDGSLFYKNSGCYGGAITITGVPADNSVIINDCTFKQNTAYDGAGIYMYNVAAPYTISNSVFENNNAAGTGSSGYVAAGGAIVIISCTGEGKITGSTFTNNSAESDGGAVSVENTDLLVSDCKFYNNSATNGAGIHFTGDANSHLLTLTGSVFTGQSAKKGFSTGGSGAVEIYKNNAQISECVFLNNTGGANSRNIYHYNVGTVTVTDSVLDAIVSIPESANTDVNYGTTKTVWVYVNDGTFGTNRDKIVVMDVNGEDKESPVTGIIAGQLRTSYKFTDVGHYDLVVENITSDAGNTYVFNTASASFNIIAPTGPFVVESTGFGYATLAAALAKTNGSGDTITVTEAGTYTGEGNIGVTIAQNVAIKAAEGLDVIFDAAKADTNILTIANGNDVKLEGLAFTGVENTNTKFGAVVNHGTLTVTDCEFYDNTVKVNGGAGNNGAAAIFSATDATGLTITGSTFKNNLATPTNPTDHINTGGIGAVASWATSGAVLIKDSVFENNEARFGGAVEIENLNQIAPAIVGCNFTDNIAYVGAGINFNDGCIVENVANCTFTGNTIKGPQGAPTTGSMGAAICAGSWTDDSVLMLGGCKFIENKGDASDGSSGGAIRLANKASGIIVDSEFIGNEARIGSAISIGTINNDNAYLIVDNCNFTDNNALMYGAVSIDSEAIKTTITRSTFSGNTAPDDRNIFNMGTLEGIERNTFDINDTTIEVNNIPYGEDEVINGTFDAGVSYDLTGSTVSLTINGAEVTATVTDGNKFTTTVTKPDVGTYPVVFNKVTDSDNNVYVPENPVETSYTVDKIDVEVSVTADPVTFPTQATVVVNANVPGTYTIRVGNKDYAVVVGDTGSGSALIDVLNPGTYEIDLSADLGPNYDPVVQIPAGTLTVNPQVGPFVVESTGLGYATLAEALAKTNGSGDTITVVEAGTYSGEGNIGVTIAQDVAIKAAEGLDVVFNANGATDSILTIAEGKKVSIDGIDFTGANAAKGGAIYINKDAEVAISNADFTENTASTRGGAIYSEGTLTVSDCTFDKNDITTRNQNVDNGGAAIYNYGGTLTVKYSSFTNNLKDYVIRGTGGATGDLINGIIMSSGATTITGSEFINNSGCYGGAVAVLPVDGSTVSLTVDDCDFINNLAYCGAAIQLENCAADYAITNSRFENNTATGIGSPGYGAAGGAIDILGSSGKGTITNCIFSGNDAPDGAGINVQNGDITVDKCAFMENTGEYAAGLEGWNSKVVVTDSYFIDNAVTEEGAGIYIYGTSTLELTGSVFDGNTAPVNRNIHSRANPSTIERNTFDINATTIEVNDIPYGQDEVINGTFDAGVNYDLTGATVYLTINNEEVTATVTEGNKFTTTVTKPVVGTYPVVFNNVTDSKNNVYLPINPVETSYTVYKATPVVEVNDTTAEWGVPVTIPVKVTDENGNPITGSVIVTVDWTVDGVTQVVELDENGYGEATFVITGALGDATITANYTGNDNYESVNGTATLIINDTTEMDITVTANEVDYGQDTIITIEAVNGRGVAVTLAKVNVTIDDGEAQELEVGADGTINLGKLAAGEHNIVVTANDGIHKEATNSTVAIVNPIAAEVNASAANYAFDETGKLIVTVSDLAGNPLSGVVAIEIDDELYAPEVEITGGRAEIDLTGFEIGEHSVHVVFTNPNYRVVDAVTHFNVTKKTPTIDVEGDEYLMPGDSAFVTVTVKDGNKGINGTAIVTVDGTNYAVEIIDGEGQLIITDLFPEKYSIAAKFLENDNYTEAVYSGDAVIDFLMHYANFDIVITNGTYGEQLTVTVDNVTNKEGDKLTGTVFGGIYDEEGTLVGQLAIQVSNGAGQETIAAPCAGTLSATASFMDDDYEYGSETKNITVIVAKAQPTIAVTYENGNFTITLDGVNGEKLNETVTVSIDGTPVDIAARTDNGTFSFIDNGIAPGDHTVVVSFAGNKNYLADTDDLGFKVPKATPVVEVNDTTTEWGVPVTIPVKVTDENGDPLTGTVIVTVNWGVDGKSEVVELDENGYGEATFVITETLGDATITANYTGNDNYESVKETASLTITESTVLNLEVTANEVTYGEDTILTVTATNGRGVVVPLVRVNLTIDGVTEMYPVIDGQVTVGKLPAGVTEINVSISGGVYQDAEAAVNATVNPAIPDLVLTPGEGNITIDVFDGDYPISGNATVIVDGDTEHPIEVTIDETGHAVVPIDAAPGAHTVEVTFAKENYENVTKVATVTVPKVTPIVYVNGTEVEYGTPATINITVTDEEGNPINGTVIVVASWEVDGETQVVELVDGKGKATFVLAGLGQGAYADINATYVENDNYTTAYNDTEIIKITPSTELTLDVTANEATFGEDTILTIVAKDGADAEVPLTKVNVTVDGVTNEYDVDENGTVNLGNLSIGDHEITVSVDDGFHEEATADVNATVKPAEANVTVTPGEGNVTVEAKDKDGNPINGTAIIVVDGGEPIEVPIDETGKIEYPIDAEPGAHTVEVTFTNPDYENVTKTVVVNVPKYEATLTIANATEPVYGQNVTIVPTLVPADATGTITYYVDGSTAGTELAIGENFIVSGLTAGPHTIVAKYNGDGNYSVAESNTLTLNVAKAPLTFEVVDAIAYYPDTGTINVAASADDTFTILVNGVEYSVTVENGKGSVKVNEKLDVGEYDITWNIPDGDNYIGTEGSAVYQVVPAAPDFSIIGSPEINYGQNNTIIPTITEGATGNITYTIDGAEIGKTGVNENFTVEGLDVGEYTIVATYSGDNNYGTVKANFTFKVLPIDVAVSVSSDEVYYPNTGFINVTASAPGTYTVLVGNKTYTAEITTPGETVTIPVTDLFEVGKYDINVTAPASQNYNAVDTGAIGTYVVSKAKSVIEVTYDNATGKITVTLEGEEDHVKLSETISVEVDGVAISGAKTTDGVFVSEDLELTPGKHSVFAVFVGNENYLGSYDQLNLDIPKFGTAEVTISAAPIKEGEEAVINITVKDGDKGLTGVVTVTLDGTDYAVDVTDGTGQLTVKNLVATETPTTTYPITAKFNGNDEYAEATGTGEINVTDYNDVIIVIAGGEEGAVATLIDSDLNNITGKVNVTVDGVGPNEYDVVDGKVNIPISEEGNHTVKVEFAGDDNHPPADATEIVYVGQNLIPTSLTVTVADIKYTEDAEVVVILKDEAGNLISGKVNITIGDASKEVTVTGGHASTKFSGLNANSYTVIAEFASDGTYASSVATTPLTVKQLKTRIIARNMTTTAINVTEDGRIGQYFSWTLVDEKGRVLADKNVSIGFNANVYNRVTNSSGQARLQINLQNSGPYTFAISFLGDENYEGCFEVVKIDVNKQKAQLTAKGASYKASAKTKTLSATYKTKAGNPIVGKTVKFTVNGKTYSAKTDSKGVAKVNVSLTKAGSYTVEVKAPATNTYAETTKKVTLKLT